MPELLCPVCGSNLKEETKRYFCDNGHSFDRAGSGYVNLLISRQSGSQHGDDKLMVRSRRDFLNKGYYEPLKDAICAAVLNKASNSDSISIVDAGCGECYYTASVEKTLIDSGKTPSIVGIDISKDALKMGDKRGQNIKLAVSSAYRMPVADNSCDVVINVFAPFAGEEYERVLKPGGILLHASPDEKHLWELKEAVYEKPYLNTTDAPQAEGLEIEKEESIKYRFELDNGDDIKALFFMTPYAHKTGKDDIARLDKISNLDVGAEFILRTYVKK